MHYLKQNFCDTMTLIYKRSVVLIDLWINPVVCWFCLIPTASWETLWLILDSCFILCYKCTSLIAVFLPCPCSTTRLCESDIKLSHPSVYLIYVSIPFGKKGAKRCMLTLLTYPEPTMLFKMEGEMTFPQNLTGFPKALCHNLWCEIKDFVKL